MLNITYRKTSLELLQTAQDKYNAAYNSMNSVSTELYEKRQEAIELIKSIEDILNSIADSPEEFPATLEKISKEREHFRKKEKYAEEAFKAEKAAGGILAAGAVAGISISTVVPQGLKMIATTYGTTSTGVAINTLKGAAKSKAAKAWIGRKARKFLIKKGTNAAAGKAVLAIASSAGYVITAADLGITMFSLSEKNRKLAEEAVKNAKEIEECRESMEETRESISAILIKTNMLYGDLSRSVQRLNNFKDADYDLLTYDDQTFLGSIVNNTYSLAKLLNETVN